MLGQVVSEARSFPGFDEVWVVLGAAAEEILAKVDLDGCGVVENPEWEEGLASSLRAGLDALSRLSKAENVLVMLGDQPGVGAEVVEKLLAVAAKSTASAIVPKYRYLRGNPVLFRKTLWSRLMSLSGDEGASGLLLAHPEWVEEVWVESLAPRDVDVEGDVEELRPRR